MFYEVPVPPPSLPISQLCWLAFPMSRREDHKTHVCNRTLKTVMTQPKSSPYNTGNKVLRPHLFLGRKKGQRQFFLASSKHTGIAEPELAF